MIKIILLACGILMALVGAAWYIVAVARNLNGPSKAVCCVLAGVILAVIGNVFFG